jgi:diguanylate cyclase (GGDEF)-like protein
MAGNRPKGNSDGVAAQMARARPERPDGPHERVVSIATGVSLPDYAFDRDSVERVLDAASMEDDTDLGRVLREVKYLREVLKSGRPDPEIMSEALLLAVRCALKHSILERELSLALTDDLTGLHNRRGFMSLAAHQLKLARRNTQGALLFFADVDNLKYINDSYGHREGDLALMRAAAALGETFRDSDVLARFGGDEFAVLAIETTNQNQQAILRRMDESLAALNADESRYQVRLSVGVARFDPLQALPLDELIVCADEAMYEQKRRRQS